MMAGRSAQHPRLVAAAVVAWVLAVAAATIPPATSAIYSWLDASWNYALELAPRMHLPVGSRVLWTYGPYGSLTDEIDFFTRQWYEAVAATLVTHVALVTAVAVLLIHRRVRPLLWLPVTAALVLGLPALFGLDVEGALLVAVLAFLAVDLTRDRDRVVAAVLTGGLLALLGLVKLTGVPLVAGILLVSVVAMVVGRSWRPLIALLVSGLVVGTVLWLAAGLHLHDIPTYLRAAIELGSGYSGAMYFGGLTPGIVVAGAVIVVVGIIAVFLLVRRRGTPALFLVLMGITLFPIYKDSFVRDGPVRDAQYFGAVAILGALALVILTPSLRAVWSRRNVAPAMLMACVVALGISWRATDTSDLTSVGARMSSYGTVIQTLTNRSAQLAPLDVNVKAAQAFYKGILQGLPSFFPGATVDVVPWDIAIFYADPALNWDPRPVLQSYQAYTSWLDNVDATFMRGNTAPDFIIDGLLTTDDRYAAFDEPAMFRALLENYRIARVLGPPAVVLRRVSAPPVQSTTLGTTCAALGVPVDVPRAPGHRVYADISVSRTIGGRLLDLLSKAAELRITLRTPGFSTDRRLVAATAGDGLYVSSFLDSTPDIESAITGTGGTPITSLTVHGDASTWQSQYCVTFTSTSAS